MGRCLRVYETGQQLASRLFPSPGRRRGNRGYSSVGAKHKSNSRCRSWSGRRRACRRSATANAAAPACRGLVARFWPWSRSALLTRWPLRVTSACRRTPAKRPRRSATTTARRRTRSAAVRKSVRNRTARAAVPSIPLPIARPTAASLPPDPCRSPGALRSTPNSGRIAASQRATRRAKP